MNWDKICSAWWKCKNRPKFSLKELLLGKKQCLRTFINTFNKIKLCLRVRKLILMIWRSIRSRFILGSCQLILDRQWSHQKQSVEFQRWAMLETNQEMVIWIQTYKASLTRFSNEDKLLWIIFQEVNLTILALLSWWRDNQQIIQLLLPVSTNSTIKQLCKIFRRTISYSHPWVITRENKWISSRNSRYPFFLYNRTWNTCSKIKTLTACWILRFYNLLI